MEADLLRDVFGLVGRQLEAFCQPTNAGSPKVAQMAAIALILYGGVVIVLPSALPTAI